MCFGYGNRSDAEPKGSDCYDQFSTMQECFSRYPTVYNKTGNDDDDDDDDLMDATKDEKQSQNGNMFASLGVESNVDTVDQIDEATAANSSKSDDTANKSPTPKSK